MLRINRVKVEINTMNGVYGFDTTFANGLNFLSSEENTCGKSSILAAIYYCLGLEEIIGGRGEKVLTSVYKNSIEDGSKLLTVQESSTFLEICNGEEIVTIYRTAKMKNRDGRMVTVYYGDMNSLSDPKVLADDMYVHFPNSAVNEKGFHNYLEKFLHLELPQVTTSDDSQRKLYLQLIFSCMFIEQKHGWSDLFSGMPILGIKESKKRVIEYILSLDTLDNEKFKEQLKTEETAIIQEWTNCYSELLNAATRESCSVLNFPVKPKILSETDLARIALIKGDQLVGELIADLQQQYDNVKQLKPKIVDNFEQLQEELQRTESSISELEDYVSNCRNQLQAEKSSIAAIEGDLETIAIDLSNNKDAARLRTLGSSIHCVTSQDVCPICHQHINDSLLPIPNDIPIMSIDENIRHLDAQKEMLKFALLSHRQHKEDLEKEIGSVEGRLFTLRRLAQSIRNDLYSINEGYSEAVVYKKLTLEKQVDALNCLIDISKEKCRAIKELSKQWQLYLDHLKLLPKNKFTEMDRKKIAMLRQTFIDNLRQFGYKSIPNLNDITISNESYLPLFEGFDMKFDSSASDNIRVIWAFTLALLQVSLEEGGNHPGVLIFDEPDQQSTIVSDMQSFFKSVVDLSEKCQVIMGITLKDSDTKRVIDELPKESYNQVNIPYKAFRRLNR